MRKREQTIRTGDVVTRDGRWRNECVRAGCEYAEELQLKEGDKAPPCRHCCNGSRLRYVGERHIVPDQVTEGFITGPMRPVPHPLLHGEPQISENSSPASAPAGAAPEEPEPSPSADSPEPPAPKEKTSLFQELISGPQLSGGAPSPPSGN